MNIEIAFKALTERRWDLARTTADERIHKLRLLEQAILAHRAELLKAGQDDFGKNPIEFELLEIIPTLGEIHHAIKHLKCWMKPVRVGVPISLWGRKSEIRFEPKGVVLVLSPWNYPFYLAMGPLVAAIAAGNAVFLKPSEKTPQVSAVLVKILQTTFRPDEITGTTGGIDTAQALLDLPFDHFFFTGSTQVGKKIMMAAAKHLSSVTLELGGKSPAIVDTSADLDRAAEKIAWGKFVNAGQTCVAPDYVLVRDSVHDVFIEKLRTQIAKLYGTPEQWAANADYCRIVDTPAFDRLARITDESIAAGAKVVIGGTSERSTRYFAPTVLTEVPVRSPLMEDEIFGPVLPVLKIKSLDEAVSFVRERPKPLAFYVFSQSQAVVEKLLNETSSGGAGVNEVVIHLANPELPFGGVGPSGFGSYHGQHGFRALSHSKAVIVRKSFGPLELMKPPYARWPRWVHALLAFARRWG